MLLPLHVGMRVRLTEKLSQVDNLVQESEGTVLSIVLSNDDALHPSRASSAAGDGDLAPAAEEGGHVQEVIATHAPLGVWVRFDKCRSAPLQEQVHDRVAASFEQEEWACMMQCLGEEVDADAAFSAGAVFVPAVARSFRKEIAGRQWHVVRRQVPLTSALDRTVQSSQGLTFRHGVHADMGNLNTDRDNYWLNMYVLLSW